MCGMHVSRAYCRGGVVQPGGRHLAGSAQLSKGIRALTLHAPRARRDLVQYINCVLYMYVYENVCSDRPAVSLTRAGFLRVCLYH